MTTETTKHARVAQLVEHDLAKVGAAGSSPVSRSEELLGFKKFFFLRTAIKTERNPQYKFTFMRIFIIIEVLAAAVE